jgi:hypothetical protein
MTFQWPFAMEEILRRPRRTCSTLQRRRTGKALVHQVSDWGSGAAIKMGRRKEHFGGESSFNVKRAATEEPMLRGRPILRFGTRPLCGKERQDLRCRKRFSRAVWTGDRDNHRAFVQGRLYRGSQGSAVGSLCKGSAMLPEGKSARPGLLRGGPQDQEVRRDALLTVGKPSRLVSGKPARLKR